MQNPEPKDRRRFMRLNVMTDVVYHKREYLGKEKISISKNIGKGGICLITHEEFKQNDLMDLDVYLPEEHVPIKATGKVAWVKEFVIGDPVKGRRFDVGIDFIDINDEDRNKIQKYAFRHL